MQKHNRDNHYLLESPMMKMVCTFIYILALGYSTNAQKWNKMPAIHVAAALGDTTELCRILDENPALTELQFSGFGTPLHVACGKGQHRIVEILVSRGANVNAYSKNDATPLYASIDAGYIAISLFLISNGADPNPKMKNTWGPLHSATQGGDIETVKALLKNGARVNERDLTAGSSGVTPLLCVGFNCNSIEIASLLINEGANINTADKEYGWTTLHRAAMTGCVDLVKLLLKKGAKKTLRDRNGKTALQIALERNKHGVIKILR